MKVLYINSNHHDYLQDIVYSGLVKVLGLKNVVDHPWNLRYHLPYWKYPKNMGYVKHSLLSSLVSAKRDYDAVIVGACKPDAIKAYIKLAPSLPPEMPMVFIDGGDWASIGGDLERLGYPELWEEANEVRPFDHIFKREYKIGQGYEAHVYPLPFAANMSRIPKLDQVHQYEVAFWAGESHPVRTRALELLEGQFDCDENGTARGKDMYSFSRKGKTYLRELSKCRINLSFRGGGFDTLRYWEIPAVGSMLISEKPDILIPNNFAHQESAVFCDPDLTDLLDLVRFYLTHEEKRREIALRGKNHLLEYHTDINRAQGVLAKIS
jgi:glycosyl transferase family 1